MRKVFKTKIIFEGDFKTTTAQFVRKALIEWGCSVYWTDSHELTVYHKRKEVKSDGQSQTVQGGVVGGDPAPITIARGRGAFSSESNR